MSVLTYPPASDEEIFKHCTKECGIITSTDDQQFFALGCLLCAEKFLYFDAFIGHMQTRHCVHEASGIFGGMFNDLVDANGGVMNGTAHCGMGEEEDLTDADPALLTPQMVMIKEEVLDELPHNEDILITGMPTANELADMANSYYHPKTELPLGDPGFLNEPYSGIYDDYAADSSADNDHEQEDGHDEDERSFPEDDEDDANYDDLVEESLLGDSSQTMHIKDRKMIQFIIESYRRNTFLWDHRHPQFRDRHRRQQFLDWIIMEFKRRFNISLAKDAVTRKWDNLRTVYKRECNRMAQENTNISTLWYFKELHFLNRLYGGKQQMSESVVKETVYRRRYSALWNDVSTNKLLVMVQQYPCFYNKFHIDYRSREKRGEALQAIALELQKLIDVNTVQISKRISQLRFDYSKQKQERLNCEQSNRVFVPSYSYYDQMLFMDADIAPFQCKHCPVMVQSARDMDVHLLMHQPQTSGYACPICYTHFHDVDEYNRHRQTHYDLSQSKDTKYNCDLCTATFGERANYDDHMQRHNDELLLPSLVQVVPTPSVPDVDKPFACDICGKAFAQIVHLNSHRALHSSERSYKCDFPNCGLAFSARHNLMEHVRQHYRDDEYKCHICGKGFKSSKNLQNHKQIHDAVKRYICKICGSAFAQAAGLYLHKRRHNRPNARVRQSL